MKYPFRSESASESRCRLYSALESALLRGDAPAALTYAAELRRLGVDVEVQADAGRGKKGGRDDD